MSFLSGYLALQQAQRIKEQIDKSREAYEKKPAPNGLNRVVECQPATKKPGFLKK